MPKVKPGLIQDCGLEAQVLEYVDNNVTDPSLIADRLNNVSSALALAKGEGRASFMAEDIRLFLKDHAKVSSSNDAGSDSKALSESPRAQALVSAVSDRVQALVRQSEASENVLSWVLRDIEAMQRKWRTSEASGLELPEYPVKEIGAMAKLVDTNIKLIQTLKGDEKVTQLMKANTVNVNQGVSQDEVHEVVFAVCELLGHDRHQAMTALAQYYSKKSPIDV